MALKVDMMNRMEWVADIAEFLVDLAVAPRDIRQHLVFGLLWGMIEVDTVNTCHAGIMRALVRTAGDFVNDMVMKLVDNFVDLSANNVV